MSNDNSAITKPQSVGAKAYAFKYGADPMSEAKGFLKAFDKSVHSVVAAQTSNQQGGYTPPDGDDGKLVVPQFDTPNAAGPTEGTALSASLNLNNQLVLRQAKYDELAFKNTPKPIKNVNATSGGRRSRRRRKSRRGKKYKYTKVKKVRNYKKTKRRKSKKSRKTRRSRRIRNLKL
jgi:hypothetical protein